MSDSAELTEWRSSPVPWYAVKVRTRAEDRIAKAIQEKGIRIYLPACTVLRKYTDRMKRVQVALFPGYIFCTLDITARLPVLTTPGVEYFVTFDGEPKPIPEVELASIDRALRSGLPLEPCEYLRKGDRVRVVFGSMEGVEGVLVHEKSHDRLVISVHLLQRSLSVEIDRDWVTPA